jgi:hypothetical protein
MATSAPVLIVDGNPQMTALLQRYLARQQANAQAVSNLAEAQAVLAQQVFGVVLTDAFLPSGDGLALLRFAGVHPHRFLPPHLVRVRWSGWAKERGSPVKIRCPEGLPMHNLDIDQVEVYRVGVSGRVRPSGELSLT